MGKIRKGRSQRDELKTVSSEWVQNHRHLLTPRDKAMLSLLSRFPVMTIDHLVTLTPETKLPGGKPIQPFHRCVKSHQLCRDRIRRLYDYHFVNKHSPQLGMGEGTSPQYIWLDRAGYQLLGKPGRPPKQLTIEYNHHARILDVYCSLVELEREGIITIDYLKVCYSFKPKTANIEPDLIVAFRKGNYGYKYFIEVDTGEKKEKDELKKIERYREWELSTQWIKEEWAELYKRRFPAVLYLCSGTERKAKRRISVLKEKAKQEECRGDFLLQDKWKEKIESLST